MNRFDRQKVGGAREQKASRARVFIDTLFDGEQQLRNALDLVDNCPIKPANECHRVSFGGR